jgi:site-specific DNA-methyltransferase (adenine-specific)
MKKIHPFDNTLQGDLINLLPQSRNRGFSENLEKPDSGRLAYADEKAGIYLYQANCLDIMDKIYAKYPQGCFDMIFADPPYFLSNGGITCQAGKMVKVHKGDWDKSQGADVNHEFNRQWLERCQKLLKPNGTIWVSGTMHVIFSIGFAMQQLGFKILNDIIWEKPNPPPNLACRYFTHSTETILWAAKNEKSKHMFNYDLMKKYNDDKQMKSVWRFTAPGADEKTFGKHPTQKPLFLLDRCIEASTEKGDFVFDPFSGSSTTGVAAKALGRKFCGVEMDPEYIELSKLRLHGNDLPNRARFLKAG